MGGRDVLIYVHIEKNNNRFPKGYAKGINSQVWPEASCRSHCELPIFLFVFFIQPSPPQVTLIRATCLSLRFICPTPAKPCKQEGAAPVGLIFQQDSRLDQAAANSIPPPPPSLVNRNHWYTPAHEAVVQSATNHHFTTGNKQFTGISEKYAMH